MADIFLEETDGDLFLDMTTDEMSHSTLVSLESEEAMFELLAARKAARMAKQPKRRGKKAAPKPPAGTGLVLVHDSAATEKAERTS